MFQQSKRVFFFFDECFLLDVACKVSFRILAWNLRIGSVERAAVDMVMKP